jgi:hypothetical protein
MVCAATPPRQRRKSPDPEEPAGRYDLHPESVTANRRPETEPLSRTTFVFDPPYHGATATGRRTANPARSVIVSARPRSTTLHAVRGHDRDPVTPSTS